MNCLLSNADSIVNSFAFIKFTKIVTFMDLHRDILMKP